MKALYHGFNEVVIEQLIFSVCWYW